MEEDAKKTSCGGLTIGYPETLVKTKVILRLYKVVEHPPGLNLTRALVCRLTLSLSPSEWAGREV